MDFSRLRTGELIAGLGGVALLVFLFLDWFSIGGSPPDLPSIEGIPGGGFEVDTGVSGWDSLQSIDGFLIALAGLSGVALGGLAAAGRKVNVAGLPRGAVTAVLGSLAVLLILWKLMGPGGFEIGIYLGLAASLAIAAGAIMALRADGHKPLVPVAGVATKAPSATASGVARARAAKSPAVRASSAAAKPAKATKPATRTKQAKPAKAAAPKAAAPKGRQPKRSSTAKSSGGRSSGSSRATTKGGAKKRS